MAQDIFLKINGIEGESQDSDHKNEIEVLAFNWKAFQESTMHAGSGGGAGKATVEDLEFDHYVDRSSPNLMKYCLTGKHVQEAKLTVRSGEETSFDDATASLARFSVFDTELRDANSLGQGPKTVQLSRLRLRLLPQRELTDAWIGLPLARITVLRSDGSVAIDPHLIPPVAGYGASPLLTDWVTNLHGLCRLRAQSLAARLSGNDGKSSESAEVSDFLLLQILNRYESLFEHWLRVRETSPEAVYTALRTLSAELATFVRPSTRRPAAHPAYQHADPYLSFRELIGDVQAMLNDVLVRSAQSIPLANRANGVRVASVEPSELQSFSSLVFAVAAHTPPEQLASQFPDRCKVGPSDRLAELIRSHLPGIPLQTLPVPPRQIPFNAGFVYFQIDPRGPLWEHMVKHGGLALHVAEEFPGLRLELWGVREK
ncbi:type VI secretion system baseplate subunit TssK [Variovorax sp. J22G73]|uniref:type VI secretion system baseplate subunit TssK n=1 Tax=unclassified Variovorax TaxID=663243 RepID=UPI002577ACB6|nr:MULTISPECIES: type VI secretion system baseplate subunit TssK [unclassified Variovorax]MDM0003259.1 type VI secretion system baseplate subunit TssK [Variovorax sp. J22R203]MDM0097075.1 type VI secretion system baseplate subunit TssK [Variovorax sp. J22G73]